MGLKMSKLYEQNPVNYGCPKCKNSAKVPNLAGRFNIISETECQCNGCKTIYPKSQFFKIDLENAAPLKEPTR